MSDRVFNFDGPPMMGIVTRLFIGFGVGWIPAVFVGIIVNAATQGMTAVSIAAAGATWLAILVLLLRKRLAPTPGTVVVTDQEISRTWRGHSTTLQLRALSKLEVRNERMLVLRTSIGDTIVHDDPQVVEIANEVEARVRALPDGPAIIARCRGF